MACVECGRLVRISWWRLVVRIEVEYAGGSGGEDNVVITTKQHNYSAKNKDEIEETRRSIEPSDKTFAKCVHPISRIASSFVIFCET